MATKAKPFWLVGTDTDAGKTVAAAWLVHHLGCAYWKPVQCGVEDTGGDTERLQTWIHNPEATVFTPRYTFPGFCAPHRAAAEVQAVVRLDDFALPDAAEGLICLEAAGGVMVPWTDDALWLDWAKDWGYPVVLVCRGGLGTINHTLLTIQALQRANISLISIIMNGPDVLDNKGAIERFSGISIDVHLPYFDDSPAMHAFDAGLSTIKKRLEAL
jgi:dethiobiotin synthetase